MSIIRRQHVDRYTIVPNAAINDEALAGDILGLLVFLLSKPNDWQVSIASLAATGRFGGKNKLSRDLGTLREVGYASLRRFADGSTEWIIRDEPHPQNGDGKPHPQNPDVAFGDGIQSTEFNKVRSGDIKRAREGRADRVSIADFEAQALGIADMDLPECIDREAWRDFVAYRFEPRRAKKEPFTPAAAKKAIGLLVRAHEEGHEARRVIDKTIVTGKWTGLFPGHDTRRPGTWENHHHRSGPGHTEMTRGNDDTAKPAWQRARDRKAELDEYLAAFDRGEVDIDQARRPDPQAHDGEFRVCVEDPIS